MLNVNEHTALILGIARTACGSHEWAEDFVQEAFLRVMEVAHTYDETKGDPRGWIATVVRNHVRNSKRGHGLRKVRADDRTGAGGDSDEPTSLTKATVDESAHFVPMRRIMLARIERALASLDEAHRTYAHLRIGGEENRDAAAAVGVSPSTGTRMWARVVAAAETATE